MDGLSTFVLKILDLVDCVPEYLKTCEGEVLPAGLRHPTDLIAQH
jgi:hypothetical protein